MPGSEVEDRIHNLYRLDYSSRCQLLPQVVDSELPLLVDRSLVGKQQNFATVGRLDNQSTGVSFCPNSQQVISRPEFFNTDLVNNRLNAYDLMFGRKSYEAVQNQANFWDETSSYDPQYLTLKGLFQQKSHQEYASGESPTVTTNSERSEITETSTDFHYLGGPQQFERAQKQHNILQAQSMQQPGYSDVFVQQHVMLKQLQELRRQQQMQQLGDAMQHSSLNQSYALSKQATSPQDSSLVDGLPVDAPSQIFINRTHRDGFPNADGVSNRLMFCQDQSQAFYQTSMVSQQPDGALYGIPTSSKRGLMAINSQLQGMGNDPHNFSAKAIDHAQKSTMPATLNKPFLRNNVSMNQDAFFQEGSLFKQGFQGRNAFERGIQDLGGEVTSGNIHLGDNQKNYLFPDVISRQDVASWPEILEHKKAPPEPSLGLISLDPMEEKILYNTEDNMWDASFGRQNDDGAGGFGSWSALMQSAVAEASSSDTGIQEEWSGLTFQNTELSTDNQPSSLMDREKLRPNWVDNNLHSPSSLSPRQFSALNDSVMGFSFPQQLPLDQGEHLRREDSHESIHKSFINAGEWLDCNSKQTPFGDRSHQVQPLKDLNSTWADQIMEQSESDVHTYQHQTRSYNNVGQPCRERGVNEITFNRNETDGFRWKTDGDSQQFHYMKNPGLSADEEMEARGSNFNKLSNGSIAVQNSYKLAGESHFEKKNQGAKSNDDHHSSISSEEGRQVQRTKYFHDISSNAAKLDKGFLTVPSRNARALDEMATEGGLGASANFSFAYNGQNVTGKNSHNMLELLNKVDQSKDNSLISHFHSPPSLALPTQTEEGVANTLFNMPQNLLSTSQGYSLGLAPSSQPLSHPNFIHSAYKPLSTSGLTNIGLGDKNQTSSPSSFNARSFTSNESSENAHWDEKSNTSSLHMQGDSVAAFTSNPQYGRNQLQMQVVSKAPTTHLSSHASFAGMGGQFPVFNLSSSQDDSHQLNNGNSSEQYPVLEARPASQPFRVPGMSQPGELSMQHQNMWKNKLTMEANKVIPFGQASNSIETTMFISKGLNSQLSQEGESTSSDNGTTTNLQGYLHKERESERRTISPNIEDTSRAGKIARKMPNSKGTTSLSLLASLQQQDHGRFQHAENNIATASGRNDQSSGKFVKPLILGQHYPMIQDIGEKTVETDLKKVSDVQQFTIMAQEKFGVNVKNIGLDASSLLKNNLTNFIRGTGENPTILASLQPRQVDKVSGGSATVSQNQSQIQYGSANVALSTAENPPYNQHLVPSWFKQYGGSRNGQMPMPPIYSPFNAKAAAGQLSLTNPSVNLQTESSLDRVDTGNSSQSGQISLSGAAVLTSNDPFTAPHFFASDVSGQNIFMPRSKKRKSISCDLLPWREEVKQGSPRILSISMVEEAWAESTYRLIEVGDEFEPVEDGLPIYRSKRRLILTAQLMQQLLLPAPASFLSADASSFYDSVAYFVARLSLGDACTLICKEGKDCDKLTNNDDSVLEKLEAVKTANNFANIVENFFQRTEKLENDLLRSETWLDKAMSILNLRVECQELDRFSIINRFAKFHIRQADGASSSGFSSNTCPQRYVTANPLPMNLPEEVQCLSL